MSKRKLPNDSLENNIKRPRIDNFFTTEENRKQIRVHFKDGITEYHKYEENGGRKIIISLGTSDTFFAAIPNTVGADPDGCGHLFGNPYGGSMSLQCFVNGSLARESVRNRFEYDWDQFSSALSQTCPGNGGKMVIPFFRPECSPNISLENLGFRKIIPD